MKLFVVILACTLSLLARADEAETSSLFRLGAGAKTVFPLFLGAEGNALLNDRFEVGLGFGFTPGFYASTIGGVAASIGNNSKYKALTEAALSSSSAVRLHIQYNFRGKRGWRLGLAGSRMATEGSASIDEVLGATSGNDFTSLKNQLIAAGRNPNVTMSTNTFSVELYGGYAFQIVDNFHLSTTIGFLKLFNPNVALTTELPAFNASASGRNLLRETESDIEKILNDYGYAPTVAIGLVYWF